MSVVQALLLALSIGALPSGILLLRGKPLRGIWRRRAGWGSVAGAGCRRRCWLDVGGSAVVGGSGGIGVTSAKSEPQEQ